MVSFEMTRSAGLNLSSSARIFEAPVRPKHLFHSLRYLCSTFMSVDMSGRMASVGTPLDITLRRIAGVNMPLNNDLLVRSYDQTS